MLNTIFVTRISNLLLMLLMLGIVSQITGCASGSYTAQGAGKGGTTGAISGAVGGLVSALVFGGDPAEAAARGAVYGGAVGATAGAMAGSEADRQVKQQQEAKLEKIRQQIGADAFNGLEALADCRHDEALKQADKAQQSDNPNFSLAGLWLEVLTYADKKDENKARGLFPVLVEKDWNISTEAQAEENMRKTLNALMDIRQEFNLPRVCSA